MGFTYMTVWNCTQHQPPDIKENTPRVCNTQTDCFVFHIVLMPLKPITPILLLYEPNFAAFRNSERAGKRTSLTDRSRHRTSVNTIFHTKPTGTVQLYSSDIIKGRGRQRSTSFPSQYPNSKKNYLHKKKTHQSDHQDAVHCSIFHSCFSSSRSFFFQFF